MDIKKTRFYQEFEQGQESINKGIPLGSELLSFSNAINGLQKSKIISVASPPKVGKSTFVNYAFILQPFLYSLEHNIDIQWVYYSFEMDLITQQYDFSSFFLMNDYNIYKIPLENGQTRNGENHIFLNSAYLRGRYLDDNGDIIRVHPKVRDALFEVYNNRIVPLFGVYDVKGKQVKEGKILFTENRINPTGMWRDIWNLAEKEGTIIKEKYKDSEGKIKEKFVSYVPNNPNKFIIFVVDHMRKFNLERGFSLKQNIDKASEYMVIARNLFGWTFVPIIHTNRTISDVSNMKFMGEYLYPDSDSIKDSGNLSEDSDLVITLFNPNDSKYNLSKHFGLQLKDKYDNELYPNLRTIHIVESRYCEYPQHFAVNMFGNVKSFKQLEKKK